MAVSRREFVRAGAVAGVAGIGALTAQQSGSAHGGSTSNTGCLTSTYKSRFGHDIWSDAVHAVLDTISGPMRFMPPRTAIVRPIPSIKGRQITVCTPAIVIRPLTQ